jgi:hypothetical protein
MKELQHRFDASDRETAKLRAQLERVSKQRDDLAEQLRFAIDQANRETREASRLRAELLARSTTPSERLDFCSGEHGETTGVLPRRTLIARRRAYDEEDTLVTGEL